LQYQRPVLKQELKLRMSPQLLQSINLMALPILDLRTRIQEEIEKNPALELVEDPADELPLEERPRKNADILEYFENSSDPGYNRGGYDEEAGDAKRRFMEGALARPESLQDHLIWQLSLQPIPDDLRALGELVIRNLDGNGFFLEALEKLVEADRLERLMQAVAIVQTFEPIGVAVADYRESLLLQTRMRGGAPAYTEEILRNQLGLLEKGRLKDIARKLKISDQQAGECLAFIKTLTPFPGRLYSNITPSYVVPDLLVKLRDDQFVIILNDEEIPVLGVNPFFSEMKADGAAPAGKEVRNTSVRR
jgi:RNA polymerase sigma-54 factor